MRPLELHKPQGSTTCQCACPTTTKAECERRRKIGLFYLLCAAHATATRESRQRYRCRRRRRRCRRRIPTTGLTNQRSRYPLGCCCGAGVCNVSGQAVLSPGAAPRRKCGSCRVLVVVVDSAVAVLRWRADATVGAAPSAIGEAPHVICYAVGQTILLQDHACSHRLAIFRHASVLGKTDRQSHAYIVSEACSQY